MVTGMIASTLRNSRGFGYIAQSQAFNTTALVAGQSNFEKHMHLLYHSKKKYSNVVSGLGRSIIFLVKILRLLP